MLVRLFLFLLAFGAAGGAAWLTLNIKTQSQTPVAQAAAMQVPPTKLVLVALADVPGGDMLAPTKMTWRPWPADTLNEAYILRDTRPDAIDQLSGSFVTGGFVAGEPIREARLQETNVNLMSNNISSGKRAVAVRISAENTAGGFILPGDRVDVVHTSAQGNERGQAVEKKSRIIIANVRVMAIDQTAVQNPEGSAVGKTATLELTPQETEKAMAAEASGLLSLALRSVNDHEVQNPIEEEEEIRTVRVHRASETSTVTLR